MNLNRLVAYAALILSLVMPVGAFAQASDSKERAAQAAASAKVDRLGDPLPEGALARLGTMRFRHQGNVTFAGYSGDGATLITYSADGTLRFWDARNGKELRKLSLSFKLNMRRYP